MPTGATVTETACWASASVIQDLMGSTAVKVGAAMYCCDIYYKFILISLTAIQFNLICNFFLYNFLSINLKEHFEPSYGYGPGYSKFFSCFIVGVCPLLCSGQGDYINGECLCKPGWKGKECNIRYEVNHN